MNRQGIAWLTMAIVGGLVGCGADGGGGPRPRADAGSDASDDGGADELPPLPDSPPASPIYEVPVTEEALAAVATFPVREVHWIVTGDSLTLEYDFPEALSGVADQEVFFTGTIVAPGIAEITGATGTGRCRFSPSVVLCREVFTDLARAPEAAVAMLAASGLGEADQARRAEVINIFDADPIGIVIFDAVVASTDD